MKCYHSDTISFSLFSFKYQAENVLYVWGSSGLIQYGAPIQIEIVLFFSFTFPHWVAPAHISFVLPNSATRKRKDSEFWGSYLKWLIALSTTSDTHKPSSEHVQPRTFPPDSYGLIVTVAEIRKPFKWRALLTSLLRDAPCSGKLADTLCVLMCVCLCVFVKWCEGKRVTDGQDIKSRETEKVRKDK